MATMKNTNVQKIAEKKSGAMMCPLCGSYDLAYIGFSSLECWTKGCPNMTKETKKPGNNNTKAKYFVFSWSNLGHGENKWNECDKYGDVIEGGDFIDNTGNAYSNAVNLLDHDATHIKDGHNDMTTLYDHVVNYWGIRGEDLELLKEQGLTAYQDEDGELPF